MKKLGLAGVLAIMAVIVVAVVVAGQMGETSHAYARGTVVLDDSLKEQAKGIRTLFIIAAGPDRPMPLGALKKTLDHDAEGTVYEFVLTKESMMMMPGGQGGMPPEFKLKARLDKEGVAGPDKSGDLTGEVYPVKLGQEGVEIRINRLVP
jgi:hypothetical protein